MGEHMKQLFQNCESTNPISVHFDDQYWTTKKCPPSETCLWEGWFCSENDDKKDSS